MVRVVLTDEQAKRMLHALEPVELCDPKGNVLRTLEPEISREFIAELKKRAGAPGPRYTGAQVQAHLRALQEAWDREGGFDQARMHDLLDELRSKDQT